MTKNEIEITPSTTVYDLLTEFPELEDKLKAMAPPFKKLRNAALKKSISKVATLKHIASEGNIPLAELINTIRQEAGQSVRQESFENDDYFTPEPNWFYVNKIAVSLAEGEGDEPDKMEVVSVLREAKKLKNGEIIELITSFLPAPGIDTIKAKGYSVWTTKSAGDIFKTYFLKEFSD